MTGNERVILIKGDNSKWYEQAIFIVRKDVPRNKIPVDFVSEAEKIINGYLLKKDHNDQPVNAFVSTATVPKTSTVVKKTGNGLDLFLSFAMAGCCVLLAAILYCALR